MMAQLERIVRKNIETIKFLNFIIHNVTPF